MCAATCEAGGWRRGRSPAAHVPCWGSVENHREALVCLDRTVSDKHRRDREKHSVTWLSNFPSSEHDITLKISHFLCMDIYYCGCVNRFTDFHSYLGCNQVSTCLIHESSPYEHWGVEGCTRMFKDPDFVRNVHSLTL